MAQANRFSRILFVFFVFITIFILLLFKMGSIQLFQHNKLMSKAIEQRILEVPLYPNRGDIKGRHGSSLLGGSEKEIVAVFPSLIDLDCNEQREIVLKNIGFLPLPQKPFTVVLDESKDLDKIIKQVKNVPGFVVIQGKERYGQGALATHVIGHTDPGGDEGRIGLELIFNNKLSGGRPVSVAAVVDNKERIIPGLGYRLMKKNLEYSPPLDIFLTIDKKIQKQTESIMDSTIERGSIVIMDPENGDILAMASRPNYLQYRYSEYLNYQENERFIKNKPFINRSILSYSPGSIFKIVVAAAALDTGKANLYSTFKCQGYIEAGDRFFHCFQGLSHGHINIAEAFAYSCNSYFIDLAGQVGKDILYEYAKNMGLGKKTEVPLGSREEGGENPGKLPDPGELHFSGDLALLAIGQGKVEMTPLQVARLSSIIANGGYQVYPRLVKSLVSESGEVIEKYPSEKGDRILCAQTVSKIRFLMFGVVEYGTGNVINSDEFNLGGKTGTAETGIFENGEPLYYSWFAGLVPLENTKAVVAVFVEKPLHANAAEVFSLLAKAISPYL